jgi:hypothetical protein
MMGGAAIGFWKTVGLLLGTSRRRAGGRRVRQQQLLKNRNGDSATNWGSLAVVFGVLMMAMLNGAAAFTVMAGVEAGQQREIERQGKFIVRDSFVSAVRFAETTPTTSGKISMPFATRRRQRSSSAAAATKQMSSGGCGQRSPPRAAAISCPATTRNPD